MEREKINDRRKFIMEVNEFIGKACDAYCECCDTKECIEQSVYRKDCYFRQEFKRLFERELNK